MIFHSPQTDVQLFDRWNTLPLWGTVATIGPAGTDGGPWSLLVSPSKVGEVLTEGSDLVVDAAVECHGRAGTVADRLTSRPVTTPLPVPPAGVPWLPSVESSRVDRPVNPTVLVPIADGFGVVERTHDQGWTVSRSQDGLRWQRVTDARLPAPVEADATDGLTMVAADGRALLAGITPDGGGGTRFTAWSSGDLRRWAPVTVEKPSGRPAGASLTLRALTADGGRWFALADVDGAIGGAAWASADGRSWTSFVPRTPPGTSLITATSGPTRLLGVVRPADPAAPDLLVASDDGRSWTKVAALPASRAEAVAVGETSPGTVVVALARSAVDPIEAWVSTDSGTTWELTLDGSVPLRLAGLVVRQGTVLIAGSVRYPPRDRGSVPWVATSRDGGMTWRALTPVNGGGSGACVTVVAIGTNAAVMTTSRCSGNPAPRWRATLPAVISAR